MALALKIFRWDEADGVTINDITKETPHTYCYGVNRRIYKKTLDQYNPWQGEYHTVSLPKMQEFLVARKAEKEAELGKLETDVNWIEEMISNEYL